MIPTKIHFLDEISKSDGRLTRRAREEEERERQKANAKAAKNKMKVMRTPSKNPQFNPLDEKKVGQLIVV